MPSVKEIYHKIDDVRIEADSINLNVDGLEALAATQQADVAAIKTDLTNGLINGGVEGGINGSVFGYSIKEVGDPPPPNAVQIGFSHEADSSFRTPSDSYPLPVKLPNVTAVKGDSVGGENAVQIAFLDDGLNYQIPSTSTPLPVTASGTVTADSNRGSLTAASTQSITTGGTHQQVFASNASRKFLLVQNLSDTDMYLGIGFNPSNTTPDGILLSKSGGGIVFESSYIPTQEIRIVCATAGKAFVALEA